MHNGEAEYIKDAYFTVLVGIMVVPVICCAVAIIVGGTYFFIKECLECFISNNKK